MKRAFLTAIALTLVATSATVFLNQDKALASVDNIISDANFINENAMDEGQIAAFINKFPKSCLLPRNYPQDLSPISFIEPNNYFDHGSQQTSAARIINKMSKYYHLNPQVILTTLEKEQALVSGSQGCASWRYNSAMGYNCPDGSENSLKDYPDLGIYRTCVKNPGNAGFARQVNRAAWQLRFDQERAYGNLSWGGDGNVYYYGRMTEGLRSRRQGEPAVYYDGVIAIGGKSFKLANGATAALYNYTPHFNSFERIFTAWFGDPHATPETAYVCRDGANLAGVATGARVVPSRTNAENDNLTISAPNNTGTKCAEFHTWANAGLQTWGKHTASNSYTFNQKYSKVVSYKTDAKNSLLTKVDYSGTASGRVEFHTWTQNNLQWIAHTATTAGPIDPLLSEVITADTDGDGRDEYYLVNYQQTNSGMIEVHGWSNGGNSWFRHTATNHPSVSMQEGRVIAADLNGDKKDEFIFVRFGKTSSGRVEFHVWDNSLQHWVRHTASNYPEAGYDVNPDVNEIVAADLSGRGKDTIYYVKYSNTASGRLEVHGWTDGQESWISHIATSSGSY